MLLTVEYDGRPFAGFARQPGTRTVAGELDGAVRAIDSGATLVRGASRTDSGVHAHGQRVAFDTARELPARNWAHAINAHLPSEIVVRRAASVEPGYEPRHRAISKTYRYVLFESAVRSPFFEGRAWRIGRSLDHALMQRAALPLVGEHDFAAFRAASDERKSTVRTVLRIEVRKARDDDALSEIVVEGTGFLHRMVRIIVGSLTDVARGRLEASAIVRALETRERACLGVTAPPDGLYLDAVVLDDDGRDGWP